MLLAKDHPVQQMLSCVVFRGACWRSRRRKSRRGGGGGGAPGTQKFVYQKWPNQIFPMVHIFFPHDGHFGLEGGGVRGGGVDPPPCRKNTLSIGLLPTLRVGPPFKHSPGWELQCKKKNRPTRSFVEICFAEFFLVLHSHQTLRFILKRQLGHTACHQHVRATTITGTCTAVCRSVRCHRTTLHHLPALAPILTPTITPSHPHSAQWTGLYFFSVPKPHPNLCYTHGRPFQCCI